MKKGDKVKLVDVSKLKGYEIMKQLKKGRIYTIKRVKQTGGLILEEVDHPFNIFGREQGIMKTNFELVKKTK